MNDHDRDCERELTSHGYTECRCDERDDLRTAASQMGKKGGSSRSHAKVTAAQVNGAKGGRPRGPTYKARKRPSKRYCMPCDRWVRQRVCPACGADTDKAIG